ncbi:hypothetical protein [Gorillibacterium timonense]|uniref:hypothetical protein n=1 Tax=Gorillibacterium timonense TaxID=1689269 RepID=UPI00071D9129|nr:hypothetical protein [Gorillibacterium timonense]
MKKRWITLGALVLATGIGTAGAYAASTDGNSSVDTGKDFFERMLPFAKQMHPGLTDQQIEGMYKSCRNSAGSGAGSSSMMSNSEWRGSMMNR